MFHLYQTHKTLRIMATNKNIFTYEGQIQSRTIKASQITMLITGDKQQLNIFPKENKNLRQV
jgi:hypothetical protein